MALPSTSTWNIADFTEDTIGGLLSLGSSDVSIQPSTSPYFSYTSDLRTLVAESRDGVEAYIDFNVGVPNRFTVEFVARFPQMPHHFGDLADRRVGITVADDASRGISLYFSASGLSVSRIDDYGSVSALPDTSEVTEEIAEGFKTIRIAVDAGLGRAYIYIGDGITTIPELRFIVPVEKTPAAVSDRFRFFVKGRREEPSRVEIKYLRLASDLVVANFPPVADAGPDRVVPVGQAARLDGRSSYDVEGAALSYQWRVIDAPFGSSYAADLSSGSTTDDGDADGFTDTLSFAAGTLPAWVASGDVLRLGSGKFIIDTVDNPSGFLTVTEDALPDSLSSAMFRIIRQSLLVGATTETPYAIPDVQGIYRFELVVNDGENDSEPSEALISAVGARTPFGVEPDVSFIWKALGDEWRFIEGKGVFEEAWRGVTQLLGAKLLEAWQYHYNYSIRDAQGVFQRRWLAYRTLVAETDYENVELRVRYGVLQATHKFESGNPSVTGETLVIEYATGTDGPTDTTTVTVTFSADDLSTIVDDINIALTGTGISAYTYAHLADDGNYRDVNVAMGTTIDDGDGDGVTNTLSFTPGALPSWVAAGDTLVLDGDRYTVATVNNAGGSLTVTEDAIPDDLSNEDFTIYRHCRLGIKSSTRGFRITSASTASLGFPIDTYNHLSGINGARVTDYTYHAGDGINLSEFGVTKGDLLVLNGGQSFVVSRVITGDTDPLPNQRVLLRDPLPFDATPEWDLPSVVISAEVDYERSGAYPGDLVKAEVYDEDSGATTEVLGYVVSSRGTSVAAHLDGFYGAVLDDERYEVRLIGLKRRKAVELPEDVVSIPRLQDKIPVAANPTIYEENVDYILEPFYRETDGSAIPMLQFHDSTFIDPDVEPPDILWAEVTLFDNAPNVERLFGRLAGFLRDDASNLPEGFNYLAGVAGLMYAQQRGPRVQAIRTGAQILLGQPFAEVAGLILEVRHDYSPTTGRVLIQDDDGFDPPRSEIVRAYYYTKDPLDASDTSGLDTNPETGQPWAKGDKIPQFSPIGSGVEVADMYNDPEWYYPYVRAGLITEIEKFHTFALRYNLDLVTTANLSLLFQFLTKVKPTYTHHLLVGLRQHVDDSDPTDNLGMMLVLHQYDSTDDSGVAFMYDDYRGDGTIWSAYDDGITYYDGIIDAPWDYLEFVLEVAWAGGVVTYDSIFAYDTDVVDVDGAHTGTPGSTFTLTYDMNLPAGTYRVIRVVKSKGVVLP